MNPRPNHAGVPQSGLDLEYNASAVSGMASGRSRKRFGLAPLAAAAQVSARGPADVAVTGLDAWAVRADTDAPSLLVIAVRTGAGATGYGETLAGPDPSTMVAEALNCASGLVGVDALASVAARDRLGAVSPGIRAAVDMALLDIRGKVAGAPVYDLLAGRTRDKARAMAVLGGTTEAELLEQVAAARGKGFRAFCVPILFPDDRPTRGTAFFAGTEELLEGLRQAGADDLVLDCGGLTTAAEAAGLAGRLETFHLMWMDEPTGRIGDEALQKIASETVMPLGWGRMLVSSGRFQDLLRLQVIDVLRPDIGLHGIASVRELAALAEAYYTAVAPYHRGGPIGTAASLQVAASIPNFVVQEVRFTLSERERAMHEAMTHGSLPKVADGFFELPDGPGLGLEVDEDALREYTV